MTALVPALVVLVLGELLLLTGWIARSRLDVGRRVAPYARDVEWLQPAEGSTDRLAVLLAGTASRLDRLIGGSAAVTRRLARLNDPIGLARFRVEQVRWAVIAFALVSIPAGLRAVQHPNQSTVLLGVCAAAALAGVVARDQRLVQQVRAHEERIEAEFPAVAELLALAVAAGEAPVTAIDRVVRLTPGSALGAELSRVLSEIRLGVPMVEALDAYSRRTGVAVVSRFCSALAVALERGTPLADVLHAQAADVRAVSRRRLIEAGARKEALMMVPVVFLVLPTVVVFAFWPGLAGLRLVLPGG